MTQLEMLTGDISPFASATSVYNLANKDYMSALKKGKKDIGTPFEFDYGEFDFKKGVGIPEDKKWFEYSTPEVEEVFESNQAETAELAALYALRLPLALRKPAQAWLQGSKEGRVLRELMPGAFQYAKYGTKAGWGAKKFGFADIVQQDPGGYKWKYLANVPGRLINFVRPKGGQLAGVVYGSEFGANWERN